MKQQNGLKLNHWKKQAGGQVVLDIQGLNNKLGKYWNILGKRVLFIMFFLLALGSNSFGQQEGMLEKFLKQDPADSTERARIEYNYSFSEGAKLKMMGNFKASKEMYLKCIDLQPDKSAAYYEIASISYVEEDIDMARGYIEQAILHEPLNKWYIFLAIEIANREERYLDAAAYYRELFNQEKRNKEFLTGEIDYLVKAQDHKAALKSLEELEGIFGYSKMTGLRKKDVLIAVGKDKLAFKEMERLIREYPGEVELMGVLAEMYGLKGENEKALELYNEMKKLNSGNPLVYFSLGKFYFDLDRKEEAISEFKTGFRSKDVNPEIKIQVFMELIRTQNGDTLLNDNMVELLEVMYDTDEGYPGVDIMYADYLYNKGDRDKPEVIYKRVTKNTPSNFLAWQNLLFIQNEQLDFEEMYKIATEAVVSFPNQPLFLMFKGIGGSQTGHLEEAIKALNTGLSINFNNPQLTKQFYITLGDTYYQMGNHHDAFQNFESVLALEPDNVLVLNNYSYYLSVLNQDLEKALSMIEKCIKQESDNATYLDTYAWVLFRLERYKEALETIEMVMSLDANPSGEVLEHYGDILWVNQKPDEAKNAWIRAEETGEASDEIKNKIESGLK